MPDTGASQPITDATTPMMAGGGVDGGGIGGTDVTGNPALGGMPVANPMVPSGVMGRGVPGTGESGVPVDGPRMSAGEPGVSVSGARMPVGDMNEPGNLGAMRGPSAISESVNPEAMQDIPEEGRTSRPRREVLDKDVVVKPATQAADLEIRDKEKLNLTEVQKTVIQQVKELHNVLIALSSNPSVDELAAAIGITIYLDKIGKRATAIYSGETPNALEFLKPEDTFDHSADVLQDFVIALNKDKADHLRYKLDGDFVRIYITPYRAKITADDLEYSYGDYNVDLVLALDVANGVDLDEALREHGRIMHDAVVVDVTTGNPGKLGEIQWADKNASSVSEMLAGMVYNMGGEPIGEDEATAFLTGIVAATNRFSSASTTPTTMEIASRLMEAGARHQLISKNITGDVNNELFGAGQSKKKDAVDEDRKSEREIPDEEISVRGEDERGEGAEEESQAEEIQPEKVENVEEAKEVENAGGLGETEKTEATVGPMEDTVGPIDTEGVVGPVDAVGPVDVAEPVGNVGRPVENVGPVDVARPAETVGPIDVDEPENVTKPEEKPEEDLSLLNDIKAAEESLKGAGAETVVEETKPMMIEDGQMVQEPMQEVGVMPEPMPESEVAQEPELAQEVTPEPMREPVQEPAQGAAVNKQEKVIEPSAEMAEESAGGMNKYGQMLQDALNGVTNEPPMVDENAQMMNNNVAEAYAPEVPSAPEINGVPEMNYMPMPGDQVLPPPPAPPIDMDAPVNADGLMMPGVAPVMQEVPMEQPINVPSEMPTAMNEAMPMAAELPNVMMDEPMANTMAGPAMEQPMTGPAMEPVPNPMMGATTQPVAGPTPMAEPVQQPMAPEPYDPSAFRIPGIK